MSKSTNHKSNLEKETTAIYWHIVWSNKGLFLRSLTYLISTICINVLTPLLVSMTFAALATRQGDITNNIVLLIIVVAIGVAANAYGFANVLKLAAKTQADATDLALSTLLQRSVGFHANNIGGKLVNNALDYAAGLNRLVDSIYINLIPFALIMIVGIAVVMSRSLAMGIALLALTSTILLMIIIESRRRSSLRVRRKIAQNEMIAHVSDSIVNAQAVKTFAREDDELKRHHVLSGRLLDLRTTDWSRAAHMGSIRMGVLLTLEICFIAFIGYLIKRDPSVLAVGIFSFSYMITLANRLFDVGAMLRNIEEGYLSAASMTEIITQQTEITDAPHAKKLHVTDGAIRIDNVDFSYHDSGSASDRVFSQLNLAIPAGQKIGLVGPSGGGKSTLTRLLLRFDDVDEGSISVDDQDIRQVTQTSLRRAISYVPQEPLLFHRSVFENIAYGKPDATLDEVRKAARLAYADEFIQDLPKQYDTIVGERGVKLSGGQRQRVAIARAILKDAPILILDEATSALDSESEVYIQQALKQLMKGRTTLVIAHRLSTIQQMDRIIVLDNGQIVEDGTHQQLQNGKGLYAKLWAHQSGGFIEE